MSIYENIKKIAKRRGMNLQEVAVKSGLSKNMIYQYRLGYGKCRGRNGKDIHPSYETLEKIADVLGTTRNIISDDVLTDQFIANGLRDLSNPKEVTTMNNEQLIADFQIYIHKQIKANKDAETISKLMQEYLALKGE